jgi:hypothetical protein
MSNDKPKPGTNTSGLLGDLESIRSLLEDEISHEDPPSRAEPEPEPEPEEDDADVPLLEDVVRGGVSVNESFLSGQGDFQESADASGLNEEIFKALLSDQWRESARTLIDQAREAIEQHQTEWTPEHTDELNAALKVRIDETVQQWLLDAVQRHIDDLRGSLLDALSAEIRATIDARFNQPSPDEDSDGA